MGLLREVETVARGWRWTRRPLAPGSVGHPDFDRLPFPTEWTRTPAVRAARAVILRLGLAPLLRCEIDAKVHGLDVLEGLERPVIFVGNHTSHLDACLILTSLPVDWRDRTAVGVASDYFFDTWWRGVATTLVFNAFPVDRGGVRRSARVARDMLRRGWNIVLFPEGTRSEDGWMAPFRSGPAWASMETAAPVVPVAITGAYQAMPKGKAWPAAGRPAVSVRYGRPLRAEAEERASHFSERIRQALAVTLDEDRSTWYEALRRDARGEVPDPGGPEAARWRRLWESSRPVPRAGRRSAWSRNRS